MLFFVIIKKTWINECPPQLKSIVYRRYFDDIFVLLRSKEHLNVFVNYINTRHRNIKFIFAAEDLNGFLFLDAKITRKNKRFVTLIFRKVTFREVFTNYDY